MKCFRRYLWVRRQRYCLGIRKDFLARVMYTAGPGHQMALLRSVTRLERWDRWVENVAGGGSAWRK